MICHYCNTKSKKYIELTNIVCKTCWNQFVNIVYNHLKDKKSGVYDKTRELKNWSDFDIDNAIYQCKNDNLFDCVIADSMSDLINKQHYPTTLIEALSIINNVKAF